MESILNVENIGGLKGNNTFKFKKGSLNILEAPNSSGKTSIVKALASVLSVTDNGKFKPLIDEEARNLGLKSNERNPQQGFVNVHSDVGKVNLDLNGKNLKFVVKQNGEILESHKFGNQDFLLAGILSNDSRIMKQLNSVEGDEIEPGDFYWAVTELSSAKIYDEETNFLEEKKEDLLDQIDYVEQKIYFLRDSEDDLKKLKDNRSLLEKEKEKFEKIINKGGIEALVKEKARLYNEVNKFEKQKSNLVAQKERIEPNLKRYENEIRGFQKNYENIKSNLDDITVEIQGLEEQKLSLENEKRVKVPHLKELRNQKDGELNIFTTALPSVEEHSKEVNCPLCKMGTIDYPTIKKHLDELRDDKKNLNNQIKEINMHYNEVSNNISRLSQRKTDIEDKIDEYESRKQQATNQLTNLQGTIKQQLDEIKRFDEKIEGILKSLDEINAQVTGDDEKLIKEYDKKQLDLRDNQLKINEIKKEREKSSMNIKGVDFKPKEAKKKYEQIIKFIEKAVEFTSKRSKDQKKKAKVNFNQNIQNLIKKLGFQEFSSI